MNYPELGQWVKARDRVKRFSWTFLDEDGFEKEHIEWVSVGDIKCYIPEPYYVDISPEPVEGVFVGVRTVSNGNIEFADSKISSYRPTKYIKLWLVVPSIRSKPVYVLPEDTRILTRRKKKAKGTADMPELGQRVRAWNRVTRRVEVELRYPSEIQRRFWALEDDPKPVEGVFVGERTVSNGEIFYDGYDGYDEYDTYAKEMSGVYRPTKYLKVWLVVQSIGRKPVYVLPEDVEFDEG